MERKLIKRYCQTEMCRNFCAYNLLVKILRHYAKSAWHWKHRIPRWLSGEKSACQCKGAGDIWFDPGSGRSPGGGNGNPFREDPLEEEKETHSSILSFPGGSDGKESACSSGDQGSIPGLEDSPGEGNGNPLQYSCLENPMDGEAWWAAVHGVAKSWTQQSDFTFTFQYSYLENTMERGAWWATVHGVTDMTVLGMTEHALTCTHRKHIQKKIKKTNIYLASGHI